MVFRYIYIYIYIYIIAMSFVSFVAFLIDLYLVYFTSEKGIILHDLLLGASVVVETKSPQHCRCMVLMRPAMTED